MSRSRRVQQRSMPGDGCYLCTGRVDDAHGRRRHNAPLRDQRAPTVAEQLDSMCDCPNCRVGKEDRCYMGAATEIGEDCSICGGPCDGLGSFISDRSG
jgi:rubredoxin